jgi:hypothetical protein
LPEDYPRRELVIRQCRRDFGIQANINHLPDKQFLGYSETSGPGINGI